MSDLPEYVLERTFDAPRETVWKAWTDPVLVSRWYGPNIETVIHAFDLQPGGAWLNEMKMGDNSMFSKMVFQEVTAPEQRVAVPVGDDEEVVPILHLGPDHVRGVGHGAVHERLDHDRLRDPQDADEDDDHPHHDADALAARHASPPLPQPRPG